MHAFKRIQPDAVTVAFDYRWRPTGAEGDDERVVETAINGHADSRIFDSASTQCRVMRSTHTSVRPVNPALEGSLLGRYQAASAAAWMKVGIKVYRRDESLRDTTISTAPPGTTRLTTRRPPAVLKASNSGP